ncbi:dTDP-4-dehydrorhamnose 3,5-epimerase [Halomonas sp.]|uniref:dTDP-4-dehydrorhamnose 3,5-epimerase n=1 Tax=Halomonas sp. TaxID=1486246 RepID=UPI00298DA202|nr:dTDP-4-dehydrorhamnose 3,5-epimerase [Halomonas sp.]MDW7748755.1 dTDP-4-dehydrorhamnose 3,5-epimerase [Halomonas sp.]
MQAVALEIPDVKLLTPDVFGDARGFFMESYNRRTFDEVIGEEVSFVQDNHSRSAQGVLRGLHYQVQQPQGKLLRVLQGEILDVAVDLRRESPDFGRWVSVLLDAENHQQLWVPPGFAHGFVVLSESADVFYKTTDYYAPRHERAIRWDDAVLGIDWRRELWQWKGEPTLSPRDAAAPSFHEQTN